MKFGKYLLDQGVEAWAEFYLNYKELKHGIKRVVAAQKTAEGQALQGEFDGPLGSPAQEQANFERLLTAELEKISLFYLARESEYIAQYSRVHEPAVKAALAHADRLSPDMTELHDFFEYCRHVDDLRNFTVLNYIGVLKILKKYDKKTDGQLKPKWAPRLMQEPFYTSTALASLFTEVQCLCAQLIWLVKRVAPSPQDFSCPICHKILQDPIVLSCTDRFCRTCLADVVNGVDGASRNKCPKCQKAFDSLDPSSYHVDNILSKFVSTYFRSSAGWAPASYAIDMLLTRSNPPSRRGSPVLAPVRALPAPPETQALPPALLELGHAAAARPSRGATPRAATPSVIELAMAPTASADYAYAARLAQERPRALYAPTMEPRTGPYETMDASTDADPRFPGPMAWLAPWSSIWEESSKPLSSRALVWMDVAWRSLDQRRLLAAGVCALFIVVVWAARHTVAGTGRVPSDLPELAEFAMARPPVSEFPNTVFVGHKHNDADSICSAIAAAHLYHGAAARSDAINRETAYLLNRFQLEAPLPSTDASFATSNWCLLDHNQKDKVADGVNLGRLVCVIDHHQLQANAVEVIEPRSVEIQPWGSTATILAFKYVQHAIPLPAPIAGCLLGGILSDTVNLRGPTTTPTDRMAAEYLARVAGIQSVDDFVNEMFRAKSDTDGLDIREIVTMDYKQFSMRKRKLGFGVAETINPRELIARKAEIIADLSDIKKRDGIDLMFFAIVDVVNLRSVLLGASAEEERIIQAGFQAVPLGPHLYDGRGLVSRKKDFIPILTRFLRSDADLRGEAADDDY